MKKQILGGMLAVAIASVAFMNMDFGSKKQKELSALHLANIEALADGESGGTTTTCHNSIKQEEGNRVFYCGTCDFVQNSAPSFWSSTKTCK